MCLPIVKVKGEDEFFDAPRPIGRRPPDSRRTTPRVSYYAEYPIKPFYTIPAPSITPIPAPQPSPIFVLPPTPPPAATIIPVPPSPPSVSAHSSPRYPGTPQFVEITSSRSPSASPRQRSSTEYYRREELREWERSADHSPARLSRHSEQERSPKFETFRYIDAPGEERETFERARYVGRKRSRSRSRSRRRESYVDRDSPRRNETAAYGEKVTVVVTDADGNRRTKYRYR